MLVATDIAARGIDVDGISHVVNYDLPDEPETYVHRIGRTGRAGAEGHAVTFCAPDEIAKLRAVEKVTRTTLLAPAPGAERSSRPVRGPVAKPNAPARAERARRRRPRRTQRAA